MSKIRYFVSELSYDGKYGIVGVDDETKHSAVTMPFLTHRNEADALAVALTLQQVPIPIFCDTYLAGNLWDLVTPSLL